MSNEPRETVWGRSGNSKRVHLFINGKRQCILNRHDSKQPVDIFPEWDISDPLTCGKCKERLFWLQKGAVPVKAQNVQNGQALQAP